MTSEPATEPCNRASRADRILDSVAAWAALALITACVVYIAHLAIVAYL